MVVLLIYNMAGKKTLVYIYTYMTSTLISWTRVHPDLYTKFAAEFLGCMMFHFIGSLAPTATANSVALMTLVYFTAKLSGAHLNPAISWVFNMLGHTNPLELVVYAGAQISGAMLGALWLALLVPGLVIGSDKHLPFDGCFVPDTRLVPAQVMGFEAMGTFMFVLPVFSVVWYTQHKQGYGTTGPIMVGLSLLAAAYAVGGFTGAALNPARVLASYAVFGCVPGATVGYYIGGQLLGAFLATLVIVPWYGISNKPWYMAFMSEGFQRVMQSYQPSIEILTHQKVQKQVV